MGTNFLSGNAGGIKPSAFPFLRDNEVEIE
jgi:hypothetical protein